MLDAGPSTGDRPRTSSSPLIRRETILLVVLCVVAVLLFGITRSLASWSRATMVDEAARAYARGLEAEAAGDSGTAIDEFRRAVFNDRETPEYTLRLAAALADLPGGAEEAERLLLRLREQTPDESEINYRLARLASRRGDVATAVRYYNHAMYGLMTEGADLDRRHIRMELIGVLLDYGDREGAVAELAALGRELPDEVDEQMSAARLAMRASEHRMAFDRFRRAIELDPKNAAAEEGAGEAAFALLDFRGATQHLDAALRLGASGAELASTLAVARLIENTDPLRQGLAMAERARRLDEGLDWVAGRVEACPAPSEPAPEASADTVGQEPDAEAAAPAADGDAVPDSPDMAELERLRDLPQRSLRDSDVVAAGVSLIVRLHTDVAGRCPDDAPIAHAWTLIGRAHPGDAP